MPVKTQKLQSLRAAIDAIDVKLHGLLVARAAIIAKVPAVKGRLPVYIRPGREADMLRDLTARPRGQLPDGLVHILWREMIGAFTLTEGPLTVGVALPRGRNDAANGYWDLARNFYGGLTPLKPLSVAGALTALRAGEIEVALLPYADPHENWWTRFGGAQDHKKGLAIFACLPFTGYGNARGARVASVAVGRVTPERTADDQTLVIFRGDRKDVTAASLRARGLKLLAQWRAGDQWLCAVDGFLPPEDQRLADGRWLGAFATPLPAPAWPVPHYWLRQKPMSQKQAKKS